MALFRVNFFSDVLGVQCSMNVLYPQRCSRSPKLPEQPPSVLYLLHGLSDDHNAFLSNTTLERCVQQRNLMVVMPYGARSFYTNQQHGYRYYDFIADELPQTLKQFFTFSNKRECTYIAGFSMGGYGALKLALTLPERYGAVAALAPVVFTPEFVEGFTARRNGTHGQDDTLMNDMRDTFGSFPDGDSDLIGVVNAYRDGTPRPRIFVRAGSGDMLLPCGTGLCEVLAQKRFEVDYLTVEGAGHTWEFVEGRLNEMLTYLDKEGTS